MPDGASGRRRDPLITATPLVARSTGDGPRSTLLGARVTDRATRVLRCKEAAARTVVVGEAATPEERDVVERSLRNAAAWLRVDVIDGGQARYPFLIGIE